MTGSATLVDVLLLFLVALLPALVYLAWVRSTERGPREGWGVIVRAFFFGAFFATIVAALIEAVLVASGTALSQADPGPETFFLNGNSGVGVFFLVLVIAPFVEEGLKAAGVVSYGRSIRTIADGPVLGAGVGLGFGFFETFLYGLAGYFVGGLAAGLLLIAIRSLSSVLLHGASTAVFGYGYAASTVEKRGHAGASHYFAAVGLHSGYNAVVSLGAFAALLGASTALQDDLNLAGVVLGIMLAFSAIQYVRRLIGQSAHPGALADHPRYPAPTARVAVGPPPRR
jgi:RsiW-degrading membrane proteinase PrsW (M82 family)